MTNDELTYGEYRDTIKTQAEIAIEEAEDDGELNELVFEGVDSAQYIIYTGYHLDVLQNSDEGAQEWKHMVSDGDNWRDVIQAMAFDAMRNDVWAEVHKQQND